MDYFLIFVGSGLGGITRYSIYQLIHYVNASSWQATLICNIIGSFFISFILSYILSLNYDLKYLQHLLIIGFLGGFTTFSTFALDGIKLYQNNTLLMILYILSSLIGCLIICAFGFYIGNLLFNSNNQ
jgi:CrcB protein